MRVRAERAGEWEDVNVQTLWLARGRPWRSLAVVPGGADVCALHIAAVLASSAWVHRRMWSCIVDLRRASPSMLDRQLRRIEEQVDDGELVLVALRSVFENPSTPAIASALDAAVLCVGLRTTGVDAARETLERIGRERFIGSVLLRRRANGARVEYARRV